jgi:hypothetical protein
MCKNITLYIYIHTHTHTHTYTPHVLTHGDTSLTSYLYDVRRISFYIIIYSLVFFVYTITASRRSLSKRRFFRLIIIFNKASSSPGMGFLGLLRRFFWSWDFTRHGFFFPYLYGLSFFRLPIRSPTLSLYVIYLYPCSPYDVCPVNLHKIIATLLNNTHVFFCFVSPVVL